LYPRGCYDLFHMNSAVQMAHGLGMAISPLFTSESTDIPGEHYAMLDGRRASFACSAVEASEIPQENSKNWQWSADLAHHVLITRDEVEVRSGRDPQVHCFRRSTVETRLEEFLTFLDNSRRYTLPDVVPFLVGEFRAVWAAGNYAEGQSALAAFLFALCAAGESEPGILDDPIWRRNVAGDIGVGASGLVAWEMRAPIIECARRMRAAAPFGLRLVPSLVLRHAAGRLFQEAHAVLEWKQLGLFGGASIATTPTYSPTGAYFTPVSIARLLAEWALHRWPVLPSELIIADFACGSAVFLTESLRTLERRGFKGAVRIVGRDTSDQAVMMAKVAVRAVQRDIPAMQVAVDISRADALDATWPEADIVLMNPPFRSWERMDGREREWVHGLTKGKGRPDLSVGFVESAVRNLRPAGVLAALVPAGVLASDGLSRWRDELLERATPSLIAVLGEHGLFQHALVNVGMLALQANTRLASGSPLCVAWSSAETGAASRAIRAIRRSISQPNEPANSPGEAAGWSITTTSIDALRQRPSWLPGAGALGQLLESINATTGTSVDQIFRVRQGIRTGANEVFIQPKKVVDTLPKREQRHFKEVVDAASFVNGDIEPQNYLFVPEPTWATESEVSQAIPHFFNNYLQTRRESLINRKRKSSDNSRWWELTWPRFWAFDGRPRLVSKRFGLYLGLYPAFARDLEGRFAVVQANAWIPDEALAGGGGDEALREILTAYWWMLNSRIAIALLREYCPNVAGGQLDLEHKYVKHVPLPHLPKQFQQNPSLQVLASSIRTRHQNRLPTISDRDQFAAAAFGTSVSDWNLSGLELPD
jgi:SAM-dependent methyltransferase